jgi:hypothetical protein
VCADRGICASRERTCDCMRCSLILRTYKVVLAECTCRGHTPSLYYSASVQWGICHWIHMGTRRRGLRHAGGEIGHVRAATGHVAVNGSLHCAHSGHSAELLPVLSSSEFRGTRGPTRWREDAPLDHFPSIPPSCRRSSTDRHREKHSRRATMPGRTGKKRIKQQHSPSTRTRKMARRCTLFGRGT